MAAGRQEEVGLGFDIAWLLLALPPRVLLCVALEVAYWRRHGRPGV